MKRKNVIFILFIIVVISILLIGCPEINLGTSSSSGGGDGSSTVTDTEIITNTAVTSWTAPTGYSTLTAKITLVGAGGGGGDAFSAPPATSVYGCGGEAGIVNILYNINLNSGTPYSLTIGTGGDGGDYSYPTYDPCAENGGETRIQIITTYTAGGGAGGETNTTGNTNGTSNSTSYGRGGNAPGDNGTNGAIIIEWTGTK